MPLTLLRALGPRVLVSLDPDQREGPRYWDWTGANEADTLAWARAENASRNVYTHVSWFDHGGAPRRAKKEDVRSARFLHVDLDARAGEDLEAERARILALLQAHDPPPSFAVMSGGGYNAYWELAEEVPDPEPYNRALAAALGGDACWNKDRILRLPGTTNWPNARKRAKGRAATEARLALATGVKHQASAFRAVEGREGGPQGVREDFLPGERVADLDDGRLKNVPDWAKALINQGDRADEPFGDRSAALFCACCAMARGGVDDGTMLAVITDPGFGISAHVLAQGRGADRAARRAIARAREAVGAEADFERGAVEPFPILKDSYHNVAVALRGLGATVGYDEFSCRVTVEGLEGFGPELTQDASVRLHKATQREWRFTPAIEFWHRAVRDRAMDRRYHPVRDHLAGLEWDGVERLDRWLVDWCGAEDTPYVRAVGALSLVACVRRVRQPGCKHDAMLVLESQRQGVGKSTLLRKLAIRDEWFADRAPLDGEPRELMEAIAGRWIVEIAELRGVKDARSAEAVKAALSRQADVARKAYRADEETRPRQCVFFGTTNDTGYLQDDTGNRRFWPVRVKEETFDLDRLTCSAIENLWAEACAREAAGVSLELPRGLWAEAESRQIRALVVHPWEESLQCLAKIEGWVQAVSVLDALRVPNDRRGPRTDREVGFVLKKLGFEKRRHLFPDGVQRRVWCKGTGALLREIELTTFEGGNGLTLIVARNRSADDGDL